MREIKFRFWDLLKKKMSDGDIGILSNDDQINLRLRNEKSALYVNPNMEDLFITMQYTGLHGKGGIEIWESDLLRMPEGTVVKVVYSYGAFGWVDISNECFYGIFADSTREYRDKDFEKIGNIYQNPELLL